MLFSILCVVLATYFILLPFIGAYLVVWAFKQLKSDKPVIELPIVPKKRKKANISKEAQRTLDILANIDRYDGSGIGQRDIKE